MLEMGFGANIVGKSSSLGICPSIIACCRCNRIKGGRTLKEVGLRLLKRPVKPSWVPFIMVTVGVKSVPDGWLDYLYWNVELQEG